MAVTAKPFGTPSTTPLVLKPGEVPPFPIAAEHLAAEEKTSIAAAAWKAAKGSIKAFGLLVREHVGGQIDLLKAPAAVAPPAPAAPPTPPAPPPAAATAAAPVVAPAKTA